MAGNNPTEKDTDIIIDDSKDVDQQICTFYQEGKCFFGKKCFNLHVGDIEQDADKKVKTKTTASTVIPPPEEPPAIEKKPPLRTAGDVRKRIQWDESLPPEHFSVGYLDRFKGIVEQPFSAFSWVHLADAGLDDLAIPQHCIHYFKYKGRTVWDKNIRLDHVFGSAGNTRTITEVMLEVDAQEASKDDGHSNSDESDDDDNDNIVVPSLASSNALLSSVRDRVNAKTKLRATHFLCIRVQNEEIERKVLQLQETIIHGDPLLRSCAMPTEILHITLAMVKCETKSSIDAVSALLLQLQEDIKTKENVNSTENTITVKNLDTFGSRVLYAKVEVPPLFGEVSELLEQKLRRIEDVTVTNNFDFVPHLTIMKVNRPTAKERRSKYIDSCLYKNFYFTQFGEIPFNNIYFCIINDYRGNDGFYLTCNKIEF